MLAVVLAVAPVLSVVPSQALAEDATSLLGSLKRLAQVEQGCKVNAPWANPALCREAAEEFRRLFRGEGVPYTPHHVEPFPSHPRETLSSPGKPRSKPAPAASAPMARRRPARRASSEARP